MRVRFSISLVCLIGVWFVSNAQYRTNSSSDIGDRIFFGGGGGFSGGNQFLSLSASPLIGYKITDQFSAGLQITYQYIKAGEATASNYGGGPFAMYLFSEKLFGYTQYEYLSVEPLVIGGGRADRFNFDSFFVGIGYMEPLGGNVAFQITALYNLLYGDGSNSPYQSPLQFRVGLVAGLF